MSITRRDFLRGGMAGSLGLALAGCATRPPDVPLRPEPVRPSLIDRPDPFARTTVPPPRQAPVHPHPPDPAPPAGLVAIPRSQWAHAAPILARLNPLGRVDRLTVHHEGSSVVRFTDAASTSDRLERIRLAHLDRMGAGDIGYHYIVDRGGRLWAGRPLTYQGAHVKNHNEHNIGVMVLGNFDLQQPSGPQMATLKLTLTTLMRFYGISTSEVYTHQEFNPTACPGRSLQPQIETMRSRGEIG